MRTNKSMPCADCDLQQIRTAEGDAGRDVAVEEDRMSQGPCGGDGRKWRI